MFAALQLVEKDLELTALKKLFHVQLLCTCSVLFNLGRFIYPVKTQRLMSRISLWLVFGQAILAIDIRVGGNQFSSGSALYSWSDL